MPKDIASILLRKSVRRRRDDEPRCDDCHRTPLTGELMHVVSEDRVVCSLCLKQLPESKRGGLASRRVHASSKPLAVIRNAA